MARLRRASTGEGPQCPVDVEHGFMLVHIDWGDRYWCPSHRHGGNGRFFTQAETHDYQLTEEDIMQIYETTAHSIIAGSTTIDDGVRTIAKQTKQSSGKVRDKLSTMVDALTVEAEANDAKQTARAAELKADDDAAEAAKPKTPRTPRARKEWIAPEKFAEVRDAAGLSNTAIARAWGKSPSRMTELTRGTKATQGGSIDMFNDFCAVVESLNVEESD